MNGLALHHIGYLVKDIDKSEAAFMALGFEPCAKAAFYDQSRHADFLFIDCGGARIELIRPRDETSPIWNLLKHYKNMPYHLCFETDDAEREIGFLTGRAVVGESDGGAAVGINSRNGGGWMLIQPLAPALAIGAGAHVAFLTHPRAGMIELLQR
jgi:methylmalonyl-CoA/ethylmalonyl-CoA epimerase